MALTEEQIKKLEPGDILVIHTTFDHIDDDGDLWFACPQMFDEHTIEYIHPKCVSLPGETVEKPKHDPCRPFKKGDIARPRTVYGRKEFHFKDGDILTVWRDEDDFNRVSVENQEGVGICTNALFLELITPAEELEPYSVHESEVIDGFDIVREKMCVMTFPYGSKEAGYYRNKLAAKEAAEAERDRLNAEYRKEQE